jgi:hypothetical protein
MKASRRRVVLGLAAIGLLVSIASPRALSVTFVVNNPSDVVGANPGNHVCETAPGNGACTLRRAIIEANHWPGGGAVVDLTALPGGVALLTIPASDTDDETTGDLNINASMTIVGAGSATTVIDANGSVTHDRAIRVTTGPVTMTGLTLRNGLTTFADPVPIFFNNGGGLAIGNGAAVTLNDVLVSANRVVGNGGMGGALGAGIVAWGGTVLTINASTIIGNAGANSELGVFGGGISSDGTVLLSRTVVSNNAADQGGGVNAIGGLTIVNSTIAGNTAATGVGGGVAAGFSAVLQITNSAVSANRAVSGDGGGIYFFANGRVTLTNVTVSGNAAGGSGGGLWAHGPVAIFSSTITGNQADADFDLVGLGGGIDNDGGPVSFQNTIVAGNFETQQLCVAAVCSVIPTPGDCSGTLASNGFNILSNSGDTHCTVVGVNYSFVDPGLGPLQANGGPTQTHALSPSSFAVDRGDPNGCRDSLGIVLTTDQRGYPRPGANGGRCDIGAYELGTRSLRDFNGNGEADLLWRNPTTGENGLWEMNGFGIQAAQALPGAGAPWQIAGTGDFDGDGHADILWRNPVTGENGVWLMNGFTIVSAQALPTVTPNWVVAGIGDFNGDGFADILWQDGNTGQAGIWEMNGLALLDTRLISGLNPGWQIVGVADFDGDGRSDLLWRQSTTGQAGIWFMNGFTPKATSLISGNNPDWRIVGTGDFNGDGKADILWRKPTTGENSIWLMNGVSMISGQAIPGAGTAWQVAIVADFNGDGRADILWRNPTTGENGLWEMNGFLIAAAQAIPGVSAAWEIH